MAIRDMPFLPVHADDVKGTVWESLAALKGAASQPHPFTVDSPGQGENPTLAAQEVRTITFHGSGEILLFNIDLPSGVTISLVLDGAPTFYSHGNEAGVLRWERGMSPFRFTSSLQAVLTNTTGAGQPYTLHASGA
ncbi:MAG: hypothetical protein ACYDBQ_03525 [Thermoplasmatota archaeon]